MVKICSKCGIEKPLEEFYRRKFKNSVGYMSACKTCEKLRRKQNPKFKEYDRNYQRAYYHRDYVKAKAKIRLKERYNNNKEYFRNYNKSYRENNREYFFNKAMERRDKMKNHKPLTKTEYIKLMESTDWRYFYCNCQLSNKTGKTLDHVVPINKNGSTSLDNLVPCCQSCNSSKGSKYLWEWKPEYFTFLYTSFIS